MGPIAEGQQRMEDAASATQAALQGFATQEQVKPVSHSSAETIQAHMRGHETRATLKRRQRLTATFQVVGKKAGQLRMAARAFSEAQEEALQRLRSVIAGKHPNDRTTEDAALLVRMLEDMTPMQVVDALRRERLVQRVEWVSFNKGDYITRKDTF